VILCHIVIVLCWQAWRGITEDNAVTMNKGCQDVGLREQHVEYDENWDYWPFNFHGFEFSTVLMFSGFADFCYKLSATYLNTIKIYGCGMVL
jgi:hypothetical protein